MLQLPTDLIANYRDFIILPPTKIVIDSELTVN